jgi:hypothetical protein
MRQHEQEALDEANKSVQGKKGRLADRLGHRWIISATLRRRSGLKRVNEMTETGN